MSRIVRVSLGGDEYIFAVAEDVAGGKGFEPTSKMTAKLGAEFSEIQKLIVTCSKGLFDCFASIPKPKKVTAEFGVKLVGEAGVPALAKASGEANVKVSIEWDNTSAPTS